MALMMVRKMVMALMMGWFIVQIAIGRVVMMWRFLIDFSSFCDRHCFSFLIFDELLFAT